MLRRLLFALSGRLRCRLIHISGKPYLERYFLGKAFGITAYLHRFVSGDDERNVHDHPWGWACALILCGGYREERMTHLDPVEGWARRVRRMFPLRVNIIRARDFHRITSPAPDTWTLFMHGRRVKGWGFLQHMNIADGVTRPMVVYHQPYDVAQAQDWTRSAARGCESGRVALA